MPFSIEVTARGAEAFDAVARLLPPAAEVFVADLPHQEPEVMVDACVRYARAGFRPVPHLVARNIDGPERLDRLLAQLGTDAGVERVFVLGGDREEPAGPFREALDLLDTGALPRHGIRRIALATFPEGHPAIPPDRLERALDAKLAAAARDGLDVLLVSQFLFEARPLLDHTRRLRARGIEAPLRVGVAGPADAETLLRFGEELGVGASRRTVEARAATAESGEGEQTPGALMRAVRDAGVADPALGIEGFHFFAFGDTADTIHWARSAAAPTGDGRADLRA